MADLPLPWLIVALIWAHYLFDYALQGDFLSKAKNRSAPIPGVPWLQALTAHAFIQGGTVAFLTGHLWLGAAEFAIHWLTDDAKCRGRISYNTDQAIHIACRVAWGLIARSIA